MAEPMTAQSVADLLAPMRRTLVEARRAQSLTQEALASDIGRSKALMGACERGTVFPTLPTLVVWAARLGLTVALTAASTEEDGGAS